jgi:RNA polymerase sigma factor (sigma-70 family)
MMSAPFTSASDDQLWQRSCGGDREAFGQIVERYQSLICSLAYSACGNLARSEDLGQETFITAWQALKELREPSKLRAWLCGIVRNLAANAIRREQRRGGAAESLNIAAEVTAAAADPAIQAITNEESSLLWRSLAGLTENYREPLVLYYRQGQSISEVAQSLNLSEDVVKQRLSRGRAMLRDELAGVVETTLTRTRPSRAFTVAVVAALPALAPSGAKAGVVSSAAASTAAAAAKPLLAAFGKAAFIGPAIGLLTSLVSVRAAASTARSSEERACIYRHSLYAIAFCSTMSIALAVALSQVGKGLPESPIGIVLGVLVWVAVLVAIILWISSRMRRRVMRIREATGTNDAARAIPSRKS